MGISFSYSIVSIFTCEKCKKPIKNDKTFTKLCTKCQNKNNRKFA